MSNKLTLVAARVKDQQLLDKASSGGIVRFLIKRLIETEQVDGVLCVIRAGQNQYEYAEVTTIAQIDDIAPSVYAPVNTDAIDLTKDYSNYAIVATPCILAWLADNNITFKYSCTFTCKGYLTNKWYLKDLPNNAEITDINYRQGVKPNNYNIVIQYTDNGVDNISTKSSLSGFSDTANIVAACRSCTHGFSPNASLTVMDAATQPFLEQPGTTLCIIRDPELTTLIQDEDNIEYAEVSQQAFWHKYFLKNRKYKVVE